MKCYTEKEILQIAKRFNNKKRTYLLVNPLQAKHIPVSPTESLAMMRTFGKKLAKKYPKTKLVIGLAETATAIGAAVTENFSDDCIYVHTTRENVPDALTWVIFQEEHSHATEQKIVSDNIGSWISSTDIVIIIDDEISTGKTLLNMVEQLIIQFPAMVKKQIVAASLLNRMSPEDETAMAGKGITCEYLLKLSPFDYSKAIETLKIAEAKRAVPVRRSYRYQSLFCDILQNPRTGVYMKEYMRSCNNVAETFAAQFSHKIRQGSSILVLGTEECMYPALRIGEVMEHLGKNYSVRCHATTRSPIGICKEHNYPISSGYKLKSFYENSRDTYIYNMNIYDAIIVVTDTAVDGFDALDDLAGAFSCSNKCPIFYVRNGKSVWYSEN